MSNVKRRLQEEGTYKPVIRKKTVLRKGKELKQLGLLEEDATIHDIFGDDGDGCFYSWRVCHGSSSYMESEERKGTISK